MSNQWDPDTVYDVVASEEARKILAMTSQRSMSAQQIADRLEIAEPTVYRRLNVLQEYDFLTTEQQIDADGNHYKTYRTTLKSVEMEVADGQVTLDVRLEEDLVDKFERFWTDLSASRTETTEDPLDDEE